MTTAQPEAPICQSCGMPMAEPRDFGTEADHSLNDEYCTHCYQDGGFTDSDLTIDQMSAIVADFIEADEITEARARAIARSILSDLKRWQ